MSFAEFLIDKVFQPRLEERRVLVVFDPDERFAEVCRSLASPRCRVVFTEGRPVSSREEVMERWMEMGADTTFQSQLLIHCREPHPASRSESHLHHPFAAFMEIGHTFPSPVRASDAYKALCHRFLAGRTAEVEQLFSGSEPTFAMVDSLEDGAHAVPRLRAIFESSDAIQIFKRFLVPSRSHVARLEEGSDWIAEFAQLSARTLGFHSDPRASRAETLRKRLWQHLLFSEFAGDLPGPLPPSLENLPRAVGSQLIFVNDLCKELRRNQDYKEAYREEALRVENELELHKECSGMTDLGQLDTFAFEEKQFLFRAVVAFRAEKWDTASEIWSRHHGGVWTEEGERGLLWRILELALELQGAIRLAEEDLGGMSASGKTLCETYQTRWIAVDRFYRHIEEAAAQTVDCYHEIEEVIQRVRERYRLYFNNLQNRFLRQVLQEGWPLQKMPPNSETYDHLVAPLLREGKRVVYFLIDAFRLDLAQDIEAGIGREYSVTLQTACAQLPCVTQFGMAALLPGAASKLRIQKRDGFLEPFYEGKPVGSRAERMGVFKSHLNDRVHTLNLGQFIDAARTRKGLENLQSETASIDLLVLTSTELDELGEGNRTTPLCQIPSVIQKIQSALRKCQELRFDVALLATDHGFVWIEDSDTGSVCEKPRGDWPLDKRRCLLGCGDEEPGVLRFSPTLLGIPSDEPAYVVPRALATFSRGTGYFHEGLSLPESLVPRLLVQFSTGQNRPLLAAPEIHLSVRKSTVLARTIAVTISWPEEPQLGIEQPAYEFRLLAVQNRQEVGHPTSCEHVDPASGLVKITPGNSVKISLLLQEHISEGSFQVKAIAPSTEKVIHSLELRYEPAI